MESFKTRSAILFVISLLSIRLIEAQRPSYAGSRPQSGYKDKFVPQQTTQTNLSERFGEELLGNQTQRPPVFVNVVQPEPDVSLVLGDRIDDTTASAVPSTTSSAALLLQGFPQTTTNRLPYDALGDKELVDRLNRLPADQRPFWLLNFQAIEAQRNRMQQQLLQQQNALNAQASFAGSNVAGSIPNTQNRIDLGNTGNVASPIPNPIGENLLNLLALLQANTTQRPVISPTPAGGVVSVAQRFGDSNSDAAAQPIERNSAGFPNFGIVASQNRSQN